MIEVQGLGKTFAGSPPVRAVQDVTFTARPGEVFGLLGPNGAGKTTTLRMLATLLRPDAGTARVAGHDVATAPEAVRGAIGYLSPSTRPYARLTARENIRWFAEIQGVADPDARAEELVRRFELGSYADRRCEQLSTGNLQKVSIARAMVHDPPVWILDEPTTGLDVIVARAVVDLVEDARRSGRCVVYSTHVMSEVERLCDRIGIIHEGRLRAHGTLDELRASTGQRHLEDVFLAVVRA